MKSLLFIFLINLKLIILAINLLANLVPRKYLMIFILYLLNTHKPNINIILNIHNKDNAIKKICGEASLIMFLKDL